MPGENLSKPVDTLRDKSMLTLRLTFLPTSNVNAFLKTMVF